MSILEVALKLLDGLLKMVGIITGLKTLVSAWKQARHNKKNHRD